LHILDVIEVVHPKPLRESALGQVAEGEGIHGSA